VNTGGKVTAIIQARMGSMRLPGKVMMDLAGRPVLWHVVDRLRHSKTLDEIVVATTIQREDDVIEDHCWHNSFKIYRGSSEDVLSRYFEAARESEASTVVRITSDCPVIDPAIVDTMVSEFGRRNKSLQTLDYLSNTLNRRFPRGLDVEVFSFDSLARAHQEATERYEREHVTPYIYQHPELFNSSSYTSTIDYSYYRWTLDTREDYVLMQEIYKALYKEGTLFVFGDLLELFQRRPELSRINSKVVQKKN